MTKDQMFDEALVLLRRAEELILLARGKHELRSKGVALQMLREDSRRDIYETACNSDTKLGSGFHVVSYSNGNSPTLTTAQVDEMVRAGELKPKWPDRPELRVFVPAQRR